MYLRRAWLRFLAQPQWMQPDTELATEQYVAWAKRHRFKTNVWSADEPGEMRRIARLGVDAIMSNRPDQLRQVVDTL